MRVDLGAKQYISLETCEDIMDQSFGYIFIVMLNSFCQNGENHRYDTEEDAFQAGVLDVHKCIGDHIAGSKQNMSDIDKELIMKFFNEIQEQ